MATKAGLTLDEIYKKIGKEKPKAEAKAKVEDKKPVEVKKEEKPVEAKTETKDVQPKLGEGSKG